MADTDVARRESTPAAGMLPVLIRALRFPDEDPPLVQIPRMNFSEFKPNQEDMAIAGQFVIRNADADPVVISVKIEHDEVLQMVGEPPEKVPTLDYLNDKVGEALKTANFSHLPDLVEQRLREGLLAAAKQRG